MKYQFRARVTGSPVILDKCGEGYEAATEEEAWTVMMRAIALPQMDRARYSIEPLSTAEFKPKFMSTVSITKCSACGANHRNLTTREPNASEKSGGVIWVVQCPITGIDVYGKNEPEV